MAMDPRVEAKASLAFVGTATTVLRLGAFTLLTDPNFLHRGQRVYLGYGLFSRRLTEPAMGPQDLPDLDVVLLSHLHGDHFDRTARSQLARDTPIVTTPAAADRLYRWGFRAAEPLSTWAVWQMHRAGQMLRVTAVPGTHGPGVVGRLLPPVMGSIIEWNRDGATALRLYVTGDTLVRPWLGEIVDRFGDVDAMVIHLGGNRVFGLLVTMDHRQGADLVEMIRPGITVPVHYNDYTVFRSPLSDFVAEARRRGFAGAVRCVSHGDTVELPLRA